MRIVKQNRPKAVYPASSLLLALALTLLKFMTKLSTRRLLSLAHEVHIASLMQLH